MLRRDFCRLLAIAAASRSCSILWPSCAGSQPVLPGGFNRYTQDYAQFCALPPEKRVFYKVSDGKIVEERLDESTWQQSAWNYEPGSAIRRRRTLGRCARDVTNPRSCRRWSVQTHVGFIARLRGPGMVPGCQIRHLGSLESAMRGRSWGLVRTQHVCRGPAAIQISTRTLRAAIAIRVQGTLRPMDPAELGPG